MSKPSGVSVQIPFSFSPHQNSDPFPLPSNSPVNSSKVQHDTINSTENEIPSEVNHTFSNNVSAVKILDMSSAAEIIKKLEVNDLRALNKLIVDRLNTLGKEKRDIALSRFKPGNRVRFTPNDGSTKTGTVIRVNQKTVSIAVDSDDHAWWKVSPQVLEHI